jgi:prepilin-type processing-associated H-X9-DG protein
VFCCPSDSGGGIDPNDSTQSEIPLPYFRYYGTSYWTNPLLAGAMPLAFAAGDPCRKNASEFNKTLPYMNSSRFDQESKLLLAADAGWYKAWSSRRWTSRGINPVVDWHRAGRRYNVGFMDGHADFVEIVRGMYTTARYTVMPTFELQNESVVCQSSK